MVKLYVAEFDSTQFAGYLAVSGQATTSELARWEMLRVFARKAADQAIASGAAEAVFARFEADVTLGRVTLLPMDLAIEEHFRQLALRLHRFTPPVLTRTLDAIHLATADFYVADQLVANDGNLRKCAAAIGWKVFP